MRFPLNRQISLLIVVTVLLLAACAQTADPTQTAPVATVDARELVETVQSEVLAQLAAQTSEQGQAEVATEEVDVDAIVETVLTRVQEQLAQQEPVPIAFGSEAAQAAAGGLEDSLVNLYRMANPAVVFIIVPPFGSGSGFVFSQDGYIVTNNHVVSGGRDFEVAFAGGERKRAELVGQDVDSDLAVIQVEELPAGVEPLPLGESDELIVGQFVAAIGNPFGEQGSMSLGIVSGLGRSLQSDRQLESGSSYSLPKVVQTDAPINPGNSGGPLLNLDGEVVGVNSSIRTTTGTNSGVGFSIPVDAVSRIVPRLISDGSYDYPYMGAAFDSEVSLDDQATFDLPQTNGAYVIDITAGSPADEAGLIEADPTSGRGGDLIVAIDGRPINDFSDLNSYLVFETVAGQTIEITVLRSGERVNLSLTLGSRPQQ